MCPVCLSNLALIAAGAGSAGGLAAVIVKNVRKKVRTKPEGQAPTHDAPAGTPANEEEVR